MESIVRRSALMAVVAILLATGCQTAMSAEPENAMKPPPETYEVPLRFGKHNFGAFCYNTLSCSVVYNNHQFTRYSINKPMSGPVSADYRSAWGGGYLGIRNFPPPAQVRWISLDGVEREATVDMARIFMNQLVWHKVPKSDMADFYSGPVAGEPDVVLEVNDRTVNVYMKMFIPTRAEQIPGNKHSNFRDDLFLAWTHTY